MTTEAGASTTLTVALDGAPIAPVEVPVRSSDPGEGAVQPALLRFSAADWNVPQTITVTGADDEEVDGPATYRVQLGPSTSDDRRFSGLTAESGEITNVDDDAPGVSASAPSGNTTELGGTATINVVLNTRPTADVTVTVDTDDPGEGTVAPTSLTFTSINWNAPQRLVVTGVDDEDEDGDQTFHVTFSAPVSDDPAYAELPPPTPVAVVNVDDESTVIARPPEVSNRTVNELARTSLTDISYGGYLNGESYQQDAILTYNGYQYAAYWNAAARVVLARRRMGEGEWTRVEPSPDYTSAGGDSHQTISLGVSPNDGRLHIAFDHHDSPLRYVRSVEGLLNDPDTVPWTTASFEPWTDRLRDTTVNAVTYPRFITKPNGDLLLEYRFGQAGYGDQVLWEYSGGEWRFLGAYISGRRASNSINGYVHGLEYNGDRLHVTWCWRETPDPTTNRGLFYAYSDDHGRTWRNNAGALVGTTGAAPMVDGSAGIEVWSITRDRGLINQEHMIVDHAGRVHVLLSHLPDSSPDDVDFVRARTSSQYFHYWRDLDGRWSRTPMGFPAQLTFRGKLVVSSTDQLYAILPNIRIAGASAASGWTDWTLIETEHDGEYFSDPLIDRSRLRLEDHLTIFAPQTVRTATVRIDSIDYDLE